MGPIGRRASLCLLAVVALASCGPATPPDGSPGASGEVPELLRFDAALLDGGTLHGVDLVGKDVAFWFWAPW
jgi:hypothetical protein